MNVTITGRHMELSSDLKETARTTAEQLTKFFDKIDYVNIVFDKEHKQVSTKFVLSTVKGITIVGKSEDYDPFKSLDQASDKVVRQLKKLKGKLNQKQPRDLTDEEIQGISEEIQQ